MGDNTVTNQQWMIDEWSAGRARFAPVKVGTAKEAKEHGILFYELPEKLNDTSVDPLILPVVKSINASGWVWTAESCQGHPDLTNRQDSAWGGPAPMLRLVCHRENFGRMMSCMFHALDEARDGGRRSFPVGVQVYLNEIKGDYISVLVYIDQVKNACDRNDGLLMLSLFSTFLCSQTGVECYNENE